MEMLGAESGDLDIGRRLIIIFVFLLFLWYILNFLAIKIKTGKLRLPGFLSKHLPGFEGVDTLEEGGSYKIKVVQRQTMPDGSELIVVAINERHILMARHLQSGFSYITDLEKD